MEWLVQKQLITKADLRFDEHLIRREIEEK